MKELKSFTLIELLVVTAMISLLISVVIVSVGSARKKGKDSAIMQELSQVRTVGQMIVTDTGSYQSVCDDASNTLNDASYPDLKQIEDEVKKYNGGQNVSCYSTANSFCARSPLNLGGYFCVDSRGKASTVNTNCVQANPVCQ